MNAQRNIFSAIVLLAGSGMAHAAGAAATAQVDGLSEAPAYPGVAVMEEVIVTANADDFPIMDFLVARLRELPPIEIVTVTGKYPEGLQTEDVAVSARPLSERLPPAIRVYQASPPSLEFAGPVEFALADNAAVSVAWELDAGLIEIAGQDFLPTLPDLDADSDEERILRF